MINAFVRPSVLLILLTLLSGCAGNESQAVREIATEAMREQADQNHRIAEATQNLVSAQHQLQNGLQSERANIDKQKSQLNGMRQAIELDRRRAPIIAEAIHIVGGILACLCPLLLAGYVLYSANRTSAADEQQLVNQVLIDELTRKNPVLLPAPIDPGPASDNGRLELEQLTSEPPF